MSIPDIARRIHDKFRGIQPDPEKRKNGKTVNTGVEKTAKTISNQLESYFELRERVEMDPDPWNAAFSFDIMKTVMGGTIEQIDEGARNRKFYFRPLLDDSDLMLIESSLITNRNLLADEREYLMKTLDRILLPGERMRREYDRDSLQEIEMEDAQDYVLELDGIKETVDKLHKRALSYTKKGVVRGVGLPTDPLYNRNYLNHIRILDEAIRKGYQVRLRYGKFDKDKTSTDGSMTFDYKNQSGKFSILNPYALISHHGQMYLLATHDGYENPTHYRVDRIMELHIRLDENNRPAERGGEGKKDTIPSGLKLYFKRGRFDEVLYISQHPLMGIYSQDAERRQYILRTMKSGLAILFDHFGAEVIDHIHYAKGEDGQPIYDDNNERGFKNYFYDVRVRDVFDDNMLLFLSHHHDMFEVREPADIREKLKETLEKSLKKYV